MRYSREFTITRQDMQEFYQLLVLRRWKKGILGFAVVGALVARLYLNWLNFELDTTETVLLMIATGILTAMLITLGMVVRTRGNVNRLMRKKGCESYTQSVRIDGFGVHVTANGESAKLGFDKIRAVEETAGAFYLFITDTEAWILPKIRMENREEESRTIREIFSRVMPPKHLKFKK